MPKLKLFVCAGITTISLATGGAAWADDQQATTPPAAPAPMPTPMPWPGMTAGLTPLAPPTTFEAGPLGKVAIDGVFSGIAFGQTNSAVDAFGNKNKDGYVDLSNAQLILNKSDGLVQFYVQAGAYSFPDLGVPYYKAKTDDSRMFGYVPQGFIKIVPNANFSFEVGALPTLQGAEYSYTFENFNIERGLLWNQENLVNRGAQVNLTEGPIAVSVAYTDGYFSSRYNSLSGSATYTFKNMDTLSFVAQGELDKVKVNTFVTPTAQANSTVLNLIYSHSMGNWTINPYIQYTFIPSNSATRAVALSGSGGGSTIGAAVLAKYAITPEISINMRGEYISSNGSANTLYGQGSGAYSLTVGPTYQKGIFFLRGEASYVATQSGVRGFMFGRTGTSSDQTRFIAEAGFLF